jgi:hypothetical protein
MLILKQLCAQNPASLPEALFYNVNGMFLLVFDDVIPRNLITLQF